MATNKAEFGNWVSGLASGFTYDSLVEGVYLFPSIKNWAQVEVMTKEHGPVLVLGDSIKLIRRSSPPALLRKSEKYRDKKRAVGQREKSKKEEIERRRSETDWDQIKDDIMALAHRINDLSEDRKSGKSYRSVVKTLSSAWGLADKKTIFPRKEWPDYLEDLKTMVDSFIGSNHNASIKIARQLVLAAKDVLSTDIPDWVLTDFVKSLNISGTGLKKYGATMTGGIKTWMLQGKQKIYKDRYGWISASWSINPAVSGNIWTVESSLGFAPANNGTFAKDKFAEFESSVKISGKKKQVGFGVSSYRLTDNPGDNAENDIQRVISAHGKDVKSAKVFWKEQQNEAKKQLLT